MVNGSESLRSRILWEHLELTIDHLPFTIYEKKMTARIYNFSAGPAILPVPVLEEAQRDMLSLPGVGMSVMEISHRSKTFDEIFGRAEAGLRELLDGKLLK